MSLLIENRMDFGSIISLPMEKRFSFSGQLEWNIMILLCLTF